MPGFQELCDSDETLNGIIVAHPFYWRVFSDSQPLIFERLEDPAVKEARKTGQEAPGWTLTKRQNYKLQVYERLGAVSRGCELIDHACVYLKLRPSPKTLDSAGIRQSDWLQYQLIMFLASIGALYDCALLLVSEVYELGVHPKFVKLDLLSKQQQLKGSPALPVLKSINDLIQKEIELRNRELHRMERTRLGEIVLEPDFDLLASVLFLHQFERAPLEVVDFAKKRMKFVARDLRKHIRLRSVSLLKLFGQLFDALHEPYHVRSGGAEKEELSRMIAEIESASAKQGTTADP